MKEKIQVMYTEEQVLAKVEEIAAQINKDYEGKEIHLVSILKGSIFFACEIAKHLTVPVTFDFMEVSSYGNGTKGGQLRINKELTEDLDGKHCLIIEDIIDSGSTLDMIQRMLKGRNPESLKICTLLDKPSRRETEVSVDYTGFVIPDEFVVGFGLDYAQKYRNLPYIASLEFVEE